VEELFDEFILDEIDFKRLYILLLILLRMDFRFLFCKN